MPNDGPSQVTGTQEDVVRSAAVLNDKDRAALQNSIFPSFANKEEEREYLKHRLAQAFRIFGHNGYEEGVAGHITVRVRLRSLSSRCPSSCSSVPIPRYLFLPVVQSRRSSLPFGL